MKYSILFASLVLILAVLNTAKASTNNLVQAPSVPTLGNFIKVGSSLAWVEDAGSTGPDDQRTSPLVTMKVTSISTRKDKDAQNTVYLIRAEGSQVPSGIKTDVQITLSQANANADLVTCSTDQFASRQCGNLPADMGTILLQSAHGFETHNLSCIFESKVCYVTGYGTQSLVLP